MPEQSQEQSPSGTDVPLGTPPLEHAQASSSQSSPVQPAPHAQPQSWPSTEPVESELADGHAGQLSTSQFGPS